MLYQWLYSYSDQFSVLNIFRYITVRTFISFFTAFLMCWWWGPHFIRRLVEKQIGQSIRDDGPQSHKKKAGTPTMGGGLILLSTLVPCLLWMDYLNPLVWGAVIVTWGFGAIGYIDDYLKVNKKNHRGLSGKIRLLGEFLISGGVIFTLVHFFNFSTIVYVPFFKSVNFDLGYFYPLFAALVIVGTANAVNLTDGLGLGQIKALFSIVPINPLSNNSLIKYKF